VCEGSGRSFSSFGPGLDAYPTTEVTQIGLAWDRARLTERIEERVHAMVGAGLVDEVGAIASTTGFSRTAAQGLGYKEVLDHLRGDCSLDEAIARIIVRTRQFAIRQIRWFRRDPRVHWIDVDDDPVAAAVPAVVAALEAGATRGA
jgi:tRNA dimethylallyltransferase